MKVIVQVISVTVIENSSIATINNQGLSEIATPLVSLIHFSKTKTE